MKLWVLYSRYNNIELKLKYIDVETKTVRVLKDNDWFQQFYNISKNAYIGELNIGTVNNTQTM